MSKLTERIILKALNFTVVQAHILTCEKCRDKYEEIRKHAKEEFEKNAKKVSISNS